MCGYNICTTSDKASLKRKRKTSDVNSSTSKKSKVIDSGPKPQSLVEARLHTQTSKEQLRKKQKAPKVRGEGEGPAGYRNSGRGWLGPT